MDDVNATQRAFDRWRCLIIIAGAGLCIAGGSACASERVIFEDNFAGDHLDAAAWLVENRPGNGQGGDRPELQYYDPAAVRVDHGVLGIVTSRRQGGGLPYVSGRIQSRRTFLYGRFEFRAKLPRGRGLWPALWLRTLPTLPLNGEIDVIEGFGSHPNVVQSTLHPWVNGREPRQYCAWLLVRPVPDSPRFHRPDCERIAGRLTLPGDLTADFHNYAVDWTPQAVTWSLDGQPYFSVRERIPAQPMAIVIETAVSAHWDGVPDSVDQAPQTLQVQWVRVTVAADGAASERR